MSDNVDDAESAIPWPGFVDILSAVIMVFIFFVMVTVVIISQLEKKKLEYDKESMIKTQEITEISDIKELSQQDLVALIRENKELQKKLESVYFTQDNNSKSVVQDVLLLPDDLAVISYGDFGVTLIDDVTDTLNSLDYKGKKVSIISYAPQNLGFTTVQEIALNRSFNIRNFYLEKGLPPSDIKLKINKDIEEGSKKCQNDTIENDIIYGCVHIQISK